MRKLILLILTILLIIVGIFSREQPYLPPTFVDYNGPAIIIGQEEVPLANVKTTSKTSTKRNIKKVKMKSASKKSYSKKLPTKIKTSTKTSVQADTKVQTVTKITTETVEKYTKKSKIKKVISNITTEVTTITTEQKLTSMSAKAKAPIKISNLNVWAAAPKMDSRVLSAFETLGFTVSVDSTVNYTGFFDARSRKIILANESNPTIYHELGHFLAFIAGNTDLSKEFIAIYQAEKQYYTAYNKAYVTQNSSEYFAESTKDYILNNTVLKQQRPQTYNAIASALNKITDNQVTKVKTAYVGIWA